MTWTRLAVLVVAALLFHPPVAGTQAADDPVRQVVDDYVRLYRKETLPEWRRLFLPTFTSTSTNRDGTTSTRTLDQFFESQARGFAEAKEMSETLENVTIARSGRLATAWADFVFRRDDTARRGRLILTLIEDQATWRIASLMFSYPDPAPTPTPPIRPPNFVFILVDDMRWDEMRVAGHPFIETPNMDRLAREGIRFTNAFATTPLCSPSRASFLTGQYAHTNGILDNTARPSHDLPVFPRELQQAGYQTAFFGKWHMGNDDSPRPGFNHWVAMPGQGEAVDPHLNVNGQRLRAKGYVTDVLTDYAEAFVASAGAKPFLVYLAHKAIHPNTVQRDDGSLVEVPGQPGGFVAAARHRGRYAGKTMPRRANAFKPPVDKPALMRQIGALPPLGRETATSDEEIRGRIEMLLGVDDSLGRLLAALEKSGTLDNTVVVFTSDHGYFYGEHGLNQERRLAYEETIRIPLVVRYPSRVKAGSVATEMALAIDVAPTVLELAGLKPSPGMQGRSWLPIFDNVPRTWRSSFLVEYYSDTVFPRVLNMGYSAVRTDRFKYIEYRDLQNMNELYDLEADPYEERNLVGRVEAGPRLGEMQAELQRLLTETRSRR